MARPASSPTNEGVTSRWSARPASSEVRAGVALGPLPPSPYSAGSTSGSSPARNDLISFV